MKQPSTSLNDESFVALLVRVESIINSRPLETISDMGSEAPLSTPPLLTMKANAFLPTPDIFSRPDFYNPRTRRRVQHTANELWCRWQKEFLVNEANGAMLEQTSKLEISSY